MTDLKEDGDTIIIQTKVPEELTQSTLNSQGDGAVSYTHLMKGIAPAQLKPVHIIRNELQRKFFFSQTEYGVELVK